MRRWLPACAMVLVGFTGSGVVRTTGAFATGTTWTVDASAASDPATCDPAQTYKTLTYLFGHSCPAGGDTVNVAAGTYTGGFTISANVTLNGAGANATIIKGGQNVVSVSTQTASSTVNVSVTIAGVTITGASALGGITNWGTLTLSNSSVIGNVGSNFGGGILNDGVLTVTNSTIAHNTATRGAGIDNADHGTAVGRTSLTVSRSTISYNVASGSGGGIYDQDYQSDTTVSISNSTLAGNGATFGGAIYNTACGNQLTLTNTTISGNVAQHYGGGIANRAGPASGGAACPTSVVSMANTIVAGNTLAGVGPVTGPDCYGPISNGGSNLLGIDGYTVNGSAYSCGLPGGTSASPVDPKLAPLGNYGGPTGTMALLPGSPAIGAGSTSICSAAPITNLDQRGNSRTALSPGTCDIGAYDTDSDSGPPTLPSPHTWYVSTMGSDAGTCAANSAANPFKTVNTAVGCAQDGDIVSLAPSGTPYAGTITLNKNVTLAGAGENSTTLSGGGPVVHVAATYTTAITGVTITQPSNFTGQDVANDGVLTMQNSIVRNGGANAGGGIFNGWTLTVQNSIITRNSAAYGGGIYNRSVLNVLDSTVNGNSASGSGAGIENYGYDWASALVANSTLSGNAATGSSASGGGFYDSCGDMAILINSTISRNSASQGSGGGLAFHGGCSVVPPAQMTLSNTIVAGNTAPTGPDCVTASPNSLSDGAGHNILGQADGCSGLANGVNGDQVGSSAAPIDPRLGPLAAFGGSTPTMGLLAGSPAIGQGDTATCAAAPVGNLDQRGDSRVAHTPATCDIGAFDTDSTGTILAVTVSAGAGWNLIGGAPLTIVPDAISSWSWDARAGQWHTPTGFESTGAGAWEEVSAANTELVAVEHCATGTPVSVPVQAYRWNMVGNPCDTAVTLPAGSRALLWVNGRYQPATQIPVGLAAWVYPLSGSLGLTP